MTHPDLELCRWTFETACADAEEAAAEKEYAALAAEDGEKPAAAAERSADAYESLVPGLPLKAELAGAKTETAERSVTALAFPANLRG